MTTLELVGLFLVLIGFIALGSLHKIMCNWLQDKVEDEVNQIYGAMNDLLSEMTKLRTRIEDNEAVLANLRVQIRNLNKKGK